MVLKIVFPPIPVSRGSRTPALFTSYLKGQFPHHHWTTRCRVINFICQIRAKCLWMFSHPTLKDSFPITTEQPGAESLTSYVRLGPNVFERQRQSEITKYAFIVNHTPLRKRFLHGRCLSVHFCEFRLNTWGRAQGFYSLREHPQWWDWLMPVKWQAFNK